MSQSISRVTHHSSAVSPCHSPYVQSDITVHCQFGSMSHSTLESHITVQLSVHVTLHMYSQTSQFSCQSMSHSISRVTHHSSAVSPCHSPSLESHITVQLSVHVTIHLYSHTSQFSCQSMSLFICKVTHHSSAVSPCHSSSVKPHITVQLSAHVIPHL